MALQTLHEDESVFLDEEPARPSGKMGLATSQKSFLTLQ